MRRDSQIQTPPTFVLVHGAWHGGWCWKKVAPLLRAAGCDVHTPTLTGLGERAHLSHPMIDLETHVQDVRNVLEFEDLCNVILVGHSYAGMVIRGVAARDASRLSQLVYLDAFLPEHGKSMLDYVPLNPMDTRVREKGDGWRFAFDMQETSSEPFGLTDVREIDWLLKRLRPQPYRTYTQPVDLTSTSEESLARSYIALTDAPFFIEAAERAKREGYRSFDLPGAGHDAMMTRPKELTEILLQLVPAGE